MDKNEIKNRNSLSFSHEPVMLRECIDALCIKPDGIYADCTAGGGGHSIEIAGRLDSGRLFAFDQDSEAIKALNSRLAPVAERVTIVHRNFVEAADVLMENDIYLDGVLFDLGVSSYQLDTPERGFSYMQDAPLDMRMDTTSPISAMDVVNGYSKEALTSLIYKWGEERYAPRIAAAICRARERRPIETTLELVDIIKTVVPSNSKDGHPAKRTFQAIRIEVNRELDIIEPALTSIVERLKPGGRIAVITFHSLEDRIVKQTFASMAKGCTCPPDFPVCVCGKKPIIELVNRKPLIPSKEELSRNSRSHSAKLRVAEKLSAG